MLTAQQIVTEALQISKAPGFTAQGGRALNLVLDDLVLHRDLKQNRKFTTITANAGTNGPFALGSDYLRTYDIFYQVDNFPYFLFPMGQDQFDALFKDPSVANYPYAYTTDMGSSQARTSIFIFPQSNSQLTLNHRYMVRRPQIDTPETSSVIPWFPDQDYLVHATAMRVMKITGDTRYDKFKADGEQMLGVHLIMEGDEQQVAKSIRLDPQRFHLNRALRPTKINPY